MFKLDTLELGRCISSSTDAYGREVVAQDAAAELARQLRDAGAPDAPLEEQIRVLLAAHVTMQRAGAEMPSAELVRVAGGRANLLPGEIARILALFAPIFARLTQERDEKDAAVKRWAERWEREHAEADALRQRAERAERENYVFVDKPMHWKGEAMKYERTATALVKENNALRARVAELETRPEPDEDLPSVAMSVGALKTRNTPVESKKVSRTAYERLIAEDIAWLMTQPRTLERDHIETIVRHSPEQEYTTRPEPAADVVETLRQVFVDGQANMPADPDLDPEEDARAYGEALDRAGIRAVVSALAAMGEEAWPDTLVLDDKVSLWDAVNAYAEACGGNMATTNVRRQLAVVEVERVVSELCHSRLAPVLGALRVRIAELGAEVDRLTEANKGLLARATYARESYL